MGEVDYQGLMSLPDDWWRYTRVCECLAPQFQSHLLGLWMTRRNKESTEHLLYTGSLLYYRDRLLWITAGHIIGDINRTRSAQDVEVVRMRWVDQCGTLGADSVPIDMARIASYSAVEIGVDFGVVNICDREAEPLLACDKTKLMTEDIWMKLDQAHPEGYYIFGYPEEGLEVEEGSSRNGQKWGAVTAKLACLPVKRIEYEDRYQPVGERRWWDEPDSFFGQILPFADDDTSASQLQDIDRMSGAPVYSIERTSEGIVYRLVGIQSSWVGGSVRQIRAEPIYNIVSILDALFQENSGC